MNNDLHDFKQFMKTREAASRAFVNGDVAPLDSISTHHSPASIFGPMGNCVQGASKVNGANANGSKMFKPGGESRFEIHQIAADGGLAFWAGVQRTTVLMHDNDKASPMDLRVTEIFRRENDEWKLVHRHADALKSEIRMRT